MVLDFADLFEVGAVSLQWKVQLWTLTDCKLKSYTVSKKALTVNKRRPPNFSKVQESSDFGEHTLQ